MTLYQNDNPRRQPSIPFLYICMEHSRMQLASQTKISQLQIEFYLGKHGKEPVTVIL